MNSVVLTVCILFGATTRAISAGNEWLKNTFNCSSQSLTSIPRSLPLTTEALDMSHNEIKTLNSEDFSGVPHLKFLNLSSNVIDDISNDTFKSNQELKYLDLSWNKLRNLSCYFLNFTPNLKYLDVSFNEFVSMALSHAFRNLRHLEYMGVSGKTLQRTDFQSISHIRLRSAFLNLESLTSYETESLRRLNTERIKIVVTNRLTDVDVMSDALSISEEVLLSAMKRSEYLKQALVHVKKGKEMKAAHLSLINIEMSWNDFTVIINTICQSSIKHLYIDNLFITETIKKKEVTQSNSLESLTIKNASVQDYFFFQGDLYNFIINRMLQNLTIANTPIVHMICPPNQRPFKMLDLSNNTLSDSVFSVTITNETSCKTLKELHTLVLRGNKLQQLQKLCSTTQHMLSLKHLDVSFNSLTYKYTSEHCHWSESIVTLVLSSNNLDDSVFKCLPKNIQILDLQNNQVTAVSADALDLMALTELNLGSNRLLDIPHCDSFRRLQTLLLKENGLHTPSVGFSSSCQGLGVLDVSNNPFICTCALKEFINFTNRHSAKLLHWPLGYSCSYPQTLNGTLLKDFNIAEVSCNIFLLLTVILCPTIFIIVATAILCRLLDVPWYVRMIWRWTQAKHRVKAKQKLEAPGEVLFHAFVSYSQQDAAWVKNYLLPNLEEDPVLRICQHERHFIPGKSIVGNIIRCIEQSYRSIFVLSAHFIQSEWCHYELYFAQHQLLSQDSDNIILVLLEPVPQYLIPSKFYKLKAMMAKRTYMEWPQDRNKHKLFWANLRAALQVNLSAGVGTPDTEL
nr:PREDICTED: toll-like receptor 6 [Lepisosteus oculatus]